MCRQKTYTVTKLADNQFRVASDVRPVFKAGQVIGWRASNLGDHPYYTQEAVVQSVSYSAPNTDITLTTSPITFGTTYKILPDPQEYAAQKYNATYVSPTQATLQGDWGDDINYFHAGNYLWIYQESATVKYGWCRVAMSSVTYSAGPDVTTITLDRACLRGDATVLQLALVTSHDSAETANNQDIEITQFGEKISYAGA